MFFMKKKITNLVFLITICLALLTVPFKANAAERVQPTGDVITIVIDPGHGGNNQGTQSGHTIEKVMTMITAQAMYDELVKYDNVKVYMTHTDDKDYSLKERAEFAASVNADFLYSIHYNASENHTMYGTEVWISCETPFNAYGYQFGYQHLTSFAEKGLYVRGVKNRKDDKAGNDYYGIIREAAVLSVPTVIIEHCYVDEDRDADFIKNEEDFKAFGRADALSVARYFGLKSSALSVDYSENPVYLPPADPNTVVKSTLQDRTAPEVCNIELYECDYETGELTLTVSAADYDSTLTYYDYSIDNGKTWSRLETWPGSNTLTGEYSDTFRMNLKIPGGKRPSIIVRAYNISDLFKKSNVLYFDQTFAKQDALTATESFLPLYTEGENTSEGVTGTDSNESVTETQPVPHEHISVGTTTFLPTAAEVEENNSVGILIFLKFCLALVIVLFFIVLTTQVVNYQRRKNRRKK